MNVSPSTCIELKEGTHVAKAVLMPGDPLRAKYVAEHYLENPVLFNDVRNMFGYTGMYKGREISVMGSGMGMPSFTLYAYELFHFFGVEAIIRIGSAGGLTDDTHLRDLIIAMSASTNSGMATSYGVPGIVAPTASFDLLQEAVKAADELGIHKKVGTKALALFQISDHIYTGEALSAAERQDGFREMMEVALTAASRVSLD